MPRPILRRGVAVRLGLGLGWQAMARGRAMLGPYRSTAARGRGSQPTARLISVQLDPALSLWVI